MFDTLTEQGDKLKALNAERTLYYWAKYYHIKGKNLVRQTYQQAALEHFEEALQFLKDSKDGSDFLRVKFSCKCYEAIAHLWCEPLMFDRAESFIEKAEELYSSNSNLLSKVDHIKFLIKKASFLKKVGFFDSSVEVLEDIRKDLIEELSKVQADEKSTLRKKKLLFKTYRDLARLFALKRDEVRAHDSHKKAERILKEDILPSYVAGKRSLNQSMRVEVSIKLAKLHYLKGLWISKFGFDKSVDELIETFHMFAEAIGDEQNYFGASTQLEIGSNYLRLKEPATCSAFLLQAVEAFEALFGDDHPLLQRYYNYSSEMYSYTETETDNMIAMARKYIEIVEKHNKPSDPNAAPSVFILDPLMQLISMLC